MSRIGSSSSSAVRVAATQLSNVYTVLLLVAALALVVAVGLVASKLQTRYGSIVPAGQGGEQTERDLQTARTNAGATNVKLEEGQKALDQFLGGGAAATPAAPAAPAAPATPPAAPAAPATPPAAPRAPAAPATPAPATPAAPAAPAK